MAGKNQAGQFLILAIIALPFAFCGRKHDTIPQIPQTSTPIAAQAPVQEEAADYQFVEASNLNVRTGPDGSPTGKLHLGERVPVYEQQGEWSRISKLSESPRWISSKNLCREVDCWNAKLKHSARKRTNPANSPPKAYHPKNSYTGGSCPCSGSYNCTGPRGGQYCITSGGNKRYR